MLKKIETYMLEHGMLWKKQKILIGLSGGADSVALLSILAQLRERWDLELYAIHIHHGLRKEADLDEIFCRNLSEDRKIPYEARFIDVKEWSKVEKISVEEAGREARYQAFEEYLELKQLDSLAVAHHGNDVAETLLFQLFRGSGLKGLLSIPMKRNRIIRPLLCLERSEIEEYLIKVQQNHISDDSNLENIYARNKIRNLMIPVAEEISKGAVRHMNQTVENLREIWDFMQSFAEKIVKESIEKVEQGYAIHISVIVKEHRAMQKQMIMEILGYLQAGKKNISSVHIESILEILDKQGEKSLHLPSGIKMIKSYEKLYFLESLQTEQVENQLLLKYSRYGIEDIVSFIQYIKEKTYTKCIDYDKISLSLTIRHRKEGDFLVIDDKGTKKKLKDFLINEKIPKYERDRLWLLADGSHIIWIIGKRISAHYKVSEKTKEILEVHVGGTYEGKN